jgi:hypothetical protein
VDLFVGEKCSDKFGLQIRLPRNSRDLLNAANLRHGTDGFTSPPKEGVLRIFSPLKFRRLRSGLNRRISPWIYSQICAITKLKHKLESLILMDHPKIDWKRDGCIETQDKTRLLQPAVSLRIIPWDWHTLKEREDANLDCVRLQLISRGNVSQRMMSKCNILSSLSRQESITTKRHWETQKS